MDHAEFLTRLAKILEVDALTADEPIKPVTWDSIEILETISLIDKAGKTVKIANVQACRTVGDLLGLAGIV
jgi:hypothetical protein